MVGRRVGLALWCSGGGANIQRGKRCTINTVSTDVSVILLFALAGFLLGGAYSTWKTARKLAIALAVLAVLAAAGGIAWWVGS
ncbi:hypothetical protein GCM10023319_68020 [Nocardia iowensis]